MSGVRRLIAVALVAAATTTVAAAPVVLKLATQAPTGTIWAKALLDLGATSKKNTENRVTLSVFPDGSQGEEDESIRKMRFGTLQGGLLTAGGLSFVDKAFNVFTIPFFFANDEEEEAVQKALEPRLESLLQAKGYHLLCWGTGGWVQIFSKKPLRTLAEVKKSNLYVSKDDDQMTQWYTRNGFNPKPLTLADIANQLKLPNGAIDTTPNTPYLALVTQIFTTAKYMLNVHIAPLVGAVVVTTKAWSQISQEDQAKVTAAARAMQDEIRRQAPAQDDASVKAMTARGLQVINPDDEATAEFKSAATDMGATMVSEGIVPQDIYDLAKAARDKLRGK